MKNPDKYQYQLHSIHIRILQSCPIVDYKQITIVIWHRFETQVARWLILPLERLLSASQVMIQSCISSGISWGFRIPGTDIWKRRFSSCASRNAVSRSSKNRSESSSPVYS